MKMDVSALGYGQVLSIPLPKGADFRFECRGNRVTMEPEAESPEEFPDLTGLAALSGLVAHVSFLPQA